MQLPVWNKSDYYAPKLLPCLDSKNVMCYKGLLVKEMTPIGLCFIHLDSQVDPSRLILEILILIPGSNFPKQINKCYNRIACISPHVIMVGVQLKEVASYTKYCI